MKIYMSEKEKIFTLNIIAILGIIILAVLVYIGFYKASVKTPENMLTEFHWLDALIVEIIFFVLCYGLSSLFFGLFKLIQSMFK